MLHAIPAAYKILVVDDEPDIHAVTRLSLRGGSYHGRNCELLSAETGAAAVETMRTNPDVAVILLDVVMENDHAGLDACKAIREELGNTTVRIVLRTGQPGQAPEKETINSYDIDGYLAKADLDATRLYTTVRTALKSWEELVMLQRYQHSLAILHARAVALHSFDPLPETLAHVLEAALEICPATVGVLDLQTFAEHGDPQHHSLHLSTDAAGGGESAAEGIRAALAGEATLSSMTEAQALGDGVVVPLRLHHELGNGWLYLATDAADELTLSALTLLGGHAANALYSTIAEQMLAGEDDLADSLII